MNESPDFRVRRIGLLLFAVFLVYYLVTASLLPKGAGPDYPVSNDISKFIYENLALPVFPDDESALIYSPGGTTRATRPPLSYIVSGLLAHLSPWQYGDMHYAWRHGASLLAAMALVVVYAALYIYFGSLAYAVSGTVLLGVMPQYTFIASYNNDDAMAIFAASMVVLAMVVIRRRGVCNRSIALMAASCGLVLASKLTAWLVLPFAGLYTLWRARHQVRQWWRYLLIGLPLLVLCGGWWLIWNVYHYGPDDPLLLNLTSELSERHRRMAEATRGGFLQQGIGYYQLLLQNHKNFLGESLKATVGNLDWLRLKLGDLQYLFYGLIFFTGIVHVLLVSLRRLVGRLFLHEIGRAGDRSLALERLLLVMIAFQFFMYVRFNVHHDIQVQGKYLLPVILPAWLLFFSAVETLRRGLVAKLPAARPVQLAFDGDRLTTWALGLIALVAVAVHADALHRYVIPFYHPPVYAVKAQPFETVPLDAQVIESARLRVEQVGSGGLRLTSEDADPWLVLGQGFCDRLTGNRLLRIDFHADQADEFHLFFDAGDGYGFTPRGMYRSAYQAGDNVVVFATGVAGCRQVRFDPMRRKGRVTIRQVSLAPLVIRQPD